MIDLAIVGGGAAGIAAAREASELGLKAIILEASDRTGGRACSLEWRGHMLDLGATWLHSADRNPLVPLAEQNGFEISRSPTRWRQQFEDLGFSKTEQAEAAAAVEKFAERLRSDPPGSDRGSDALEPGGEWNPYLESLNGFLNGTSLANVSAADFIAYWDESGEENWRLPRGLGAFLATLARGCDIRTGCCIGQVDLSAAHVRLTMDSGTIDARRAIIAVPTDILASGGIAFPASADDWLHAASQLPLGHVEKLFLELAEPTPFPEGAHLLGNPRSGESGSYMLRPLGLPLVECFFGGDWLEGLGPRDLEAKARDELGSLLGADFAAGLRPVAESEWQSHRFIGGSYSYAKPGQHGARAALARPLDDRLAFTGEACSDKDFATVHGAWESGRAAVRSLCQTS